MRKLEILSEIRERKRREVEEHEKVCIIFWVLNFGFGVGVGWWVDNLMRKKQRLIKRLV